MGPRSKPNLATSKCDLLLSVSQPRRCQQVLYCMLALTSAITFISFFSSPYQSLPIFPYIYNNTKPVFSSNIFSLLTKRELGILTQAPCDINKNSLPVKTIPVVATCKKWKLVACAMIQNETAYLMEWIEFHRMQGVDHFVLYTYFNLDLPEYMPMLYEAAEIYEIIDIIPARFFAQDPNRNLTVADYAQNREWSMVNCNVRYGEDAEWLLLMDAGHFVYSPTHNSILDSIEDQTKKKLKNIMDGQELFSAVKIPTVHFGTSGVKDKFQTWLTHNAYTGSVDFLFEPYNSSAGTYPLVIETNTHRAPNCKLDRHCSDNQAVSQKAEKEWPFSPSTVTLIKSGRCPPANIGECLSPTKNVIHMEPSLLRADNHNPRAIGHALGAYYLDVPSKQKFEELDKTWFSTVKDEGKLIYAESLRKAIAKLNPKVFLQVNETCHPEAVKTGQQVMCPDSHPYPFGNNGIDKWMRRCCQTNKDAKGNTLGLESESCFNNSAIDCKDPPGMQKWNHRSCCLSLSSQLRYQIMY